MQGQHGDLLWSRQGRDRARWHSLQVPARCSARIPPRVVVVLNNTRELMFSTCHVATIVCWLLGLKHALIYFCNVWQRACWRAHATRGDYAGAQHLRGPTEGGPEIANRTHVQPGSVLRSHVLAFLIPLSLFRPLLLRV